LASQRAASAFCLVLNIHDATQSMHHFIEGFQSRISVKKRSLALGAFPNSSTSGVLGLRPIAISFNSGIDGLQ
jgi:hypothetical protein